MLLDQLADRGRQRDDVRTEVPPAKRQARRLQRPRPPPRLPAFFGRRGRLSAGALASGEVAVVCAAPSAMAPSRPPTATSLPVCAMISASVPATGAGTST